MIKTLDKKYNLMYAKKGFEILVTVVMKKKKIFLKNIYFRLTAISIYASIKSVKPQYLVFIKIKNH